MKIFKKTVLNGIASTGGNHDTHVSSQSVSIKLKGVSEAERKNLRIPSYQYILP